MPRTVFFSFDYDDVLAANVARNSNVIRGVNQALPFKDKSLYEEAKKTPGAIKRAIDAALLGTSVTVILNGPVTGYSMWVRYEIAASFARGNGFLVVDINNVGPQPVAKVGPNPLSFMGAYVDPNDLEARNINIFQHDGIAWRSFVMLSSISNVDAKYPLSMVAGGGYRLEQRFTRHVHWNRVRVDFAAWIEAAARDANWPAATG